MVGFQRWFWCVCMAFVASLVVACGGSGSSGQPGDQGVPDTRGPEDSMGLRDGQPGADSADVGSGTDLADVVEVPKSQLLQSSGCTGLYGMPNEKSGVEAGLCSPVCSCTSGEFAPVYDKAFIDGLREWTLLEPPSELTEDPYASPEKYPRRDDEFCAVMVVNRAQKTYRLETFKTLEELEAAGGNITHSGACGVCSSLGTLALLIEFPDQTEPVRQCGMMGLTGDIEKVTQCLQELGYERPCAQINAYNTFNTRELCGSICMPLLNAPYQNPDGTLNACLQCDEDQSGDIFRAVAGRARRNSGVAAELCRPCELMTHIIHRY